jgi:hypothetical protein
MYCRYQLLRGGVTQAEHDEELDFVKHYLEQEAKEPNGQAWQEYLAGFAGDA